MGIALLHIVIVKPEEAIINNDELIPNDDTADSKSINPIIGNSTIIKRVEMEIGNDSEIQRIKQAESIPIALIWREYSPKTRDDPIEINITTILKMTNKLFLFFIALYASKLN